MLLSTLLLRMMYKYKYRYKGDSYLILQYLENIAHARLYIRAVLRKEVKETCDLVIP